MVIVFRNQVERVDQAHGLVEPRVPGEPGEVVWGQTHQLAHVLGASIGELLQNHRQGSIVVSGVVSLAVLEVGGSPRPRESPRSDRRTGARDRTGGRDAPGDSSHPRPAATRPRPDGPERDHEPGASTSADARARRDRRPSRMRTETRGRTTSSLLEYYRWKIGKYWLGICRMIQATEVPKGSPGPWPWGFNQRPSDCCSRSR